jgi:hypothetical protein
MSEFASFEDLTAAGVDDTLEDVEMSGGKKVRVRGLSRFELTMISKGDPDGATYERRTLALCLVEPKLSEAQVEAWQRRDPAGGDLGQVTTAVRRLSRLDEGADKSDLREVREQS